MENKNLVIQLARELREKEIMLQAVIEQRDFYRERYKEIGEIKVKRLYDSQERLIGHYKFLKNKNKYKISYLEHVMRSDITLTIEEFNQYRKDFGFLIFSELKGERLWQKTN